MTSLDSQHGRTSLWAATECVDVTLGPTEHPKLSYVQGERAVLGITGEQACDTESHFLNHVLFQAEAAQDLPRECQNPGVPALWMETIMTDTTGMNLSVALQAAAHLLEGAGVAVTGVEGVT